MHSYKVKALTGVLRETDVSRRVSRSGVWAPRSMNVNRFLTRVGSDVVRRAGMFSFWGTT